MSSFPNSQERSAASALLLLCAVPPSLSSPRSDSDPDDLMLEGSIDKSCKKSFVSTASKSSSVSFTSDDDSSEKIRARRVRFCSAVARYRHMKFKIAKKSRSKITWTSGDQKPDTGLASTVSTGTASSCLSSSSSGIYSARSLPEPERAGGKHANCVIGSGHLRLRADAIMKLLSGGGSSEVRIRQLLGDSPDTSKALRMLLKLKEVKRSGTGGRHDPYIYMISG
ncbi:putative serine-rich protein C1E8.05 [Senna tora]|uniref:Putative serine-rich protein C1E8.05 n=1 Tax=Senna tora TaxID=362788 RepID=A0A834SI91_9FABA|nr:putative serine-rich protein C1E8.05 [Senna tora]